MPATKAPKKLLVRNVPEQVRDWILAEMEKRRATQNEVLLATLHSAANGRLEPTLFDTLKAPEPPPVSVPESAFFSFVDLFAGIGGYRIGLERAGGYCRMSCEWDKHSQKTYKHWFGETPVGDIRKLKPSDIPDHDVLAAGFPCQPFSIAGVSKKKSLGQEHGFKCATQGTLFFNVATIVEIKRPPVVMLENVRNLMSHDKGRTWEVIKGTLADLRYKVFAEVIDARHWVPQHRERVFIVAFDTKHFGDGIEFEFPKPPSGPDPKLRDVLDPNPPEKYTLTDHLWNYLQDYARRHREKGNGFGYGLADLDGTTRTLSARYFKDGSEILIPQKGKNPRRLTPREAARLMGFPDQYANKIVVSDTQAYRQFGNAIVPLVAEAVAKSMVKSVLSSVRAGGNGCFLKGRMNIAG